MPWILATSHVVTKKLQFALALTQSSSPYSNPYILHPHPTHLITSLEFVQCETAMSVNPHEFPAGSAFMGLTTCPLPDAIWRPRL